MAMNRKISGRPKTLPAGILLGWLGSLSVTLAGAAILAYLISGEKISQNGIGVWSMIVLILACALGCWIAAALTKSRRLMVCGVTAAIYYLSLIGMTALFFGGQYEGMGVTALAVLAGAVIVILLGIVTNKQGKHKVKIPAYR